MKNGKKNPLERKHRTLIVLLRHHTVMDVNPKLLLHSTDYTHDAHCTDRTEKSHRTDTKSTGQEPSGFWCRLRVYFVGVEVKVQKQALGSNRPVTSSACECVCVLER